MIEKANVSPAATKVDCPVKYGGARQREDNTVSPDGRVLSYLRQFSIDFVFSESLNSIAGGWIRAVKAAPKDHFPSHPSKKNEKRDLKIIITEEIDALQKKFQESTQQNKKSAVCAIPEFKEALESPSKKFPDKQVETPAPAKDGKKKIFIRSRL